MLEMLENLDRGGIGMDEVVLIKGGMNNDKKVNMFYLGTLLGIHFFFGGH